MNLKKNHYYQIDNLESYLRNQILKHQNNFEYESVEIFEEALAQQIKYGYLNYLKMVSLEK